MLKKSTIPALLVVATLTACGGNSDEPRTVIAIPAEQQAQQEVEAALAEYNECASEAEGDARVQGTDCLNMAKDADTSWDVRVREFGNCVESGRSRDDCY